MFIRTTCLVWGSE